MNNPKKTRLLSLQNTIIAFATPIYNFKFDDVEQLNRELAERILKMREQSPGRNYSNVGGWQSEGNLLDTLGEPYASRLKNMIAQSVNGVLNVMLESVDLSRIQAGIAAWANVNQRGDSNQAHIHPGSQWSGVYYVATDPNAGGEIVFTDPRTQALMSEHPLNPFSTPQLLTITPVAGLMLLFPSFLYHSVLPYKGDSPRISIAFNVS